MYIYIYIYMIITKKISLIHSASSSGSQFRILETMFRRSSFSSFILSVQFFLIIYNLFHQSRNIYICRVLETFPGPGYLHSEYGVAGLWHSLVNFYIMLTISLLRLNAFSLRVDRDGWWFEHSMS